MNTVPTLDPAPHTFRSSFGRTAKSRVWPIRRKGGEAHPNPCCHDLSKHYLGTPTRAMSANVGYWTCLWVVYGIYGRGGCSKSALIAHRPVYRRVRVLKNHDFPKSLLGAH